MEHVKNYFEKHVQLKFNKSDLPPKAFHSKRWSIKAFQTNKDTLNGVKSKLNEFNLDEWSKHTRNRDPSSYVISTIRNQFHIELLTQAWCKFYECLNRFQLIPEEAVRSKSLSTVHICEAPGAFICSLNHYIHLKHPAIKWNWSGVTLNPNYEGNSLSQMVNDDRLIQSTTHNWHFGIDGTGDVTQFYNHKSLVEEVKGKGQILLVTADGSIDCMQNPGEQESIVEHLHYCELLTALKILSPGGNFVFKIFTTFEDSTICHVYLLNCVFEEVHFFKPSTSKSGNSEVYVICLNYIGKDKFLNLLKDLSKPYVSGESNTSMFARSDINESFLEELLRCTEFFMEKQIATIQKNITTFKQKHKPDEMDRLRNVKKSVLNCFLQTYPLRNIPKYKRIVTDVNVSIYCSKRKVSSEIHCFPNREMIYSNDLLNIENFHSFMFVRTGKLIRNVLQSKFCAKENLESLKCVKTREGGLFKLCLSQISESNEVVCISEFDQSHFHKDLFYCLKRKVDGGKVKIVFVGVPFITTFVVHLLFILSLGYKRISFYKCGVICMEKPHDFGKVKDCFAQIHKTFVDLKEPNEHFESDILQLVQTSCVERTCFYEAICNYNDNLACCYKYGV